MSHAIALLPIDVQQGFDLPPWGPRHDPGLAVNGRRLIEAWRVAGAPIFHVRHDSVNANSPLRPGQPGNAFRPGFEPLADEPLVTKSVNCAFIGTDLEDRLRAAGVDTVVMFGVSTDMCVSTTARIASNLGFRTIVVSDACWAFDLPDSRGGTIPAETVHSVHLATIAFEFGEVSDTKTILTKLLGGKPAINA